MSDMIDHYIREGLIDRKQEVTAKVQLEKGKNPFTDELQGHICFKALNRRKVVDSYIDEKYTKMIQLFAQESRNDWLDHPGAITEEATAETFDLLEKLVSWDCYSLQGIKPMIYKIRPTLDDWTLTQVLEILLGVISENKG